MKINMIIMFLLLIVEVNAFGQSGLEIMKKNKNQLYTQSTEYENTMTLINKRGQKRIRQVKRYEITDQAGNKSSLVQFIAPADVDGTCLLTIEYSDKEDDRWLYLPALNQSRRIPSADLSKSFMGTDFTYEDLEQDDINEFTYKLMGEERIGNIDCHLIEAFPKTEQKKKESGYSKRILYVEKEHFVVLKVKYYDKKSVYYKELICEELKETNVSGKWRKHKLSMNNFKRKHQTILEIENYKINNGVKQNLFTKRYLEGIGK